MEQPTHTFDPDGKVIIILSNANALFAPEASIAKQNVEKTSDEDDDKSSEFQMSELTTSDLSTHHNDRNSDKESTSPRFCIQASAKHLTSASPVFKKLLSGPWKESITFQQKDTSKSQQRIPRCITVEMLAKVAVVVDYYECKDVIRFFADTWVENKRPPNVYRQDLILWLWISWAFEDEKLFYMITATAMSHSDGAISSFGLPIPDRFIDLMNSRRQDAIEKIVKLLHGKRKTLLDGKLGCSFECSSIMYGALTKEIKSHAMLSPRPSRPFQGMNYSQLVKQIRSFRRPHWTTLHAGFLQNRNRHVCDVSTFESLLGRIHDSVDGLNLREFVSK